MNVRFEYLYRDGGNNKNWGDIIFTNKNDIKLVIIEKKIKHNIISGEFFVAEEIGLPTLYFQNFDFELDHNWHEYSGVELTNENNNDIYNRDILEFCDSLKQKLKV